MTLNQLIHSLWNPAHEFMSNFDTQAPSPEETVSKLKDLRLQMFKSLGTTSVGDYRLLFKGHGLEFKNLREYQAGDEIRKIDWNVFARTGIPYVKEHYEEKKVAVWFFVDVTASMHFGQKISKFDYTRELIGLIGLLALESDHLIGMILWLGDMTPLVIKPGGDVYQLYRIINELQQHSKNDTKRYLYRGFPDLAGFFSNRCLLFLLSDFAFLDNLPQAVSMLSKLSPRHELNSLLLIDPVEEGLVCSRGWLPLYEATSGKFLWLDTGNDQLVNAYRKMFQEQTDDRISRISAWSLCRKINTAKPTKNTLIEWIRSYK